MATRKKKRKKSARRNPYTTKNCRVLRPERCTSPERASQVLNARKGAGGKRGPRRQGMCSVENAQMMLQLASIRSGRRKRLTRSSRDTAQPLAASGQFLKAIYGLGRDWI